MRLHSQVIGHGPDLIVLHGLFGSKQNWNPTARRLSGNFRVHTVDLRNHGSSPHHDEVNCPIMAADVLGFMDHAGLARAHVLGHSLGGKVAMQLALLHQERIEKLVVADIAPRAYESVHDEVFTALREMDLSRIRTRIEADESLASSVPQHATRRFLLTNLVSRKEGGFRWRINLDALHAQRSQLTAAVTGSVPFDGPSLFLRGALSDYVLDSDCTEIRRMFSQAQIRTVEGAGHWLHVDAPDAFHAHVVHFLQSSSGN
jgi:esterase